MSKKETKKEADTIPSISMKDIEKADLLTNGERKGILPWRNPKSLYDNFGGFNVTVETTIFPQDEEPEEDKGYFKPDILTNGSCMVESLAVIEIQNNKPVFKCKKINKWINFIPTIGTYGGFRFWLCCQGKCKKRRAGVLYFINNAFVCRKCGNITYKSCNVSGKQKEFGYIRSEDDIDKIMKGSRYQTHYRGKPTKRYCRFIKAQQKNEAAKNARFKTLNKGLDSVNNFVKKVEKK